MLRSSPRRLLALLSAASLLASLTVATVAAPASAAKPKCQGQTATIVGTARGEIIRGTARRDVIVARGGHDRIYGRGGNDVVCGGGGNDIVYGGPGADRLWGQAGHDRLNGNAGNDFLAGQVGNDTLNGGINYDTCYQGTGTGAVLNCELPAAPAPPPPGPSLIPLTGILAVAYSDIDGLPGYSTGDVMIARLMDTSGDRNPGPGDTVEMGRYPTKLDATAFGDWGVKSHAVQSLAGRSATQVHVTNMSGADFLWYQDISAAESYKELAGTDRAFFQDGFVGHKDVLHVIASSPSAPQTPENLAVLPRYGDDTYVEVVLNYPVP